MKLQDKVILVTAATRGIGLAIVKEIIQRHHGTVGAENGTLGLKITISMPMLDRNLTKS